MRSVGSPGVVTQRNVKAHSNQISGKLVYVSAAVSSSQLERSILVCSRLNCPLFAGLNHNSVQEDDLKLWQKHAQVTL